MKEAGNSTDERGEAAPQLTLGRHMVADDGEPVAGNPFLTRLRPQKCGWMDSGPCWESRDIARAGSKEGAYQSPCIVMSGSLTTDGSSSARKT
jgi:hypothetical protein